MKKLKRLDTSSGLTVTGMDTMKKKMDYLEVLTGIALLFLVCVAVFSFAHCLTKFLNVKSIVLTCFIYILTILCFLILYLVTCYSISKDISALKAQEKNLKDSARK